MLVGGDLRYGEIQVGICGSESLVRESVKVLVERETEGCVDEDGVAPLRMVLLSAIAR
jgi:hypothetical protein